MRKLTTLAIAAVMVLPFLAFGQAEGYYDRSYTRLSFVKGDVFVQRAQDLGYEQGEVNLVVVQGDKLGTRDGRAEIQLGLGNILRLDRDSQVDIVGLPSRDGDPTKFHLLSGSVFFRVRSVDREKNLQIHTADASIYILEAGLYRATVLNDRETEFSVLSGQAEAAGEDGSVLVRAGEMVAVSDGRFVTEPTGLRADLDDFASWNESRDGLYARRLSKSYLPSAYSEYDSELSDYGRWSYEPEYGNVWVPTVVYNDWRPYSNGRWAWYPIIGWTWVSYEPWGWCTSHYGRWGWRFGLGWYWIPTSHWSWGPAWVHWYQGYDHIGWSPLSYYNRPAVIINNIFYNRYDRGDFPNQSRTLTVVNRNQLQNRRLSQIALNDQTVRNLGRISLRAAQPDLRPSIDRNSDVAVRARGVLSRESLRSVGKNFSSEGRRLSPSELRSPSIRKSETGDPGRERVINGRESNPSREPLRSGGAIERGGESSPRRITERAIRPKSEENTGVVSDRGPSRVVEREGTRTFPSRSNNSGANREISPSRAPVNPAPKPVEADRSPRIIRENESRSPKEKERETTGTIIKKDESSRNSLRDRTIQERPGSTVAPVTSRTSPRTSVREASPSRLTSPTDRSSISSGRSSSRISEMPSRRIEAPARSSSAPSREYSSPSRIASSPSRSSSGSVRAPSYPSRAPSSAPRITSLPSRSSSSPSRSSSSPSRITSSPSRNSSSSIRMPSSPSRAPSSSPRMTSSPSRSSSSPSRSVSAPSRSSSSPSRSTSAPSRSSSSSSRSSSGSSSGSRSSGSVRRK
jgi:hypothetical protein